MARIWLHVPRNGLGGTQTSPFLLHWCSESPLSISIDRNVWITFNMNYIQKNKKRGRILGNGWMGSCYRGLFHLTIFWDHSSASQVLRKSYANCTHPLHTFPRPVCCFFCLPRMWPLGNASGSHTLITLRFSAVQAALAALEMTNLRVVLDLCSAQTFMHGPTGLLQQQD